MVLAGALLLAGCGGSDDDHHRDNGPPPVVPLNTDELRPQSDALRIAGTIQFSTDGTTVKGAGAGIDTPNFGIVFDEKSQHYIVGDKFYSATFGAADLVENVPSCGSKPTVTPCPVPRVSFATRIGGVSDLLTIYKDTTFSTLVPTRYGAIGAWEHDYLVDFVTVGRTDWFAYGSPTPASALPKSGFASYNLTGRGTVVTANSVAPVALSISRLSIDFATGEVIGSLAIASPTLSTSPNGSFPDPQTGTPQGPFGGSVSLRGTVKGNGATGTTRGRSEDLGNFRLIFLGPKGENVMIVASAQDQTTVFSGAELGVASFLPAS